MARADGVIGKQPAPCGSLTAVCAKLPQQRQFRRRAHQQPIRQKRAVRAGPRFLTNDRIPNLADLCLCRSCQHDLTLQCTSSPFLCPHCNRRKPKRQEKRFADFRPYRTGPFFLRLFQTALRRISTKYDDRFLFRVFKAAVHRSDFHVRNAAASHLRPPKKAP